MAIFSSASADMRTLQREGCVTEQKPSAYWNTKVVRASCAFYIKQGNLLLEVVRVLGPWTLLLHHLLLAGIVLEQALLHFLHIVLQLPPLLRCTSISSRRRCHGKADCLLRFPSVEDPRETTSDFITDCTLTYSLFNKLILLDWYFRMEHMLANSLHAPKQICTFGWSPLESLTQDENFLDLAVAVARNSKREGGHMGCVLVSLGLACYYACTHAHTHTHTHKHALTSKSAQVRTREHLHTCRLLMPSMLCCNCCMSICWSTPPMFCVCLFVCVCCVYACVCVCV